MKEKISSLVQVVNTVSKKIFGVKERKEKRSMNESTEKRRDREKERLQKEQRA